MWFRGGSFSKALSAFKGPRPGLRPYFFGCAAVLGFPTWQVPELQRVWSSESFDAANRHHFKAIHNSLLIKGQQLTFLSAMCLGIFFLGHKPAVDIQLANCSWGFALEVS